MRKSLAIVSVPLADTLANSTTKTKSSCYPYSYRVQRYEKKAVPPSYFTILNTCINVIKFWNTERYGITTIKNTLHHFFISTIQDHLLKLYSIISKPLFPTNNKIQKSLRQELLIKTIYYLHTITCIISNPIK